MDKTRLFFEIADAQCKQRGRKPTARPRQEKSPFGSAASSLGRKLHAMEGRIERMGKLASKSSLFDDPAADINLITSHVRQEMAALGRHLEMLSSTRREGHDFQPHSDAVLAWLQARLNAATAAFKAAVKQREAMQNAKEERAAKLSGMSPSIGAATPSTPAALRTPGGDSARLPKQSNLLHRRRPTGAATPANGAEYHGGGRGGVAPSTPQPTEHTIDMSSLAGCGYGSPGSACGSPDDLYGMSTPQHLEQRQFWTPRSTKHRAQEVLWARGRSPRSVTRADARDPFHGNPSTGRSPDRSRTLPLIDNLPTIAP
jgi:hypothetical protein